MLSIVYAMLENLEIDLVENLAPEVRLFERLAYGEQEVSIYYGVDER